MMVYPLTGRPPLQDVEKSELCQSRYDLRGLRMKSFFA